jgi:carbon-monoxide dehydrogenase medium subunit
MNTNTKILPLEFEYYEPENLDEALELLSRFKERARIIAGGTDLLVKMKRELLKPEVLISLSRISNLKYIDEGEGSLRIGAGTPLSEIESNSTVERSYSALFEAVRSMAAPAIRNMGTIGGNLANASPACDTAPPLLVYGSSLKIKSKGNERVVPLEEFFLGPGITVLSPEELIAEIQISQSEPPEGSAFLKLGRVSADIAKINVAVYLKREGKRCSCCRIAFGSVAPTPLRIYQAEKMAEGEIFEEQVIKKVALECQKQIKPIDDVRSSKDYRVWVSAILAEEALKAAWLRSGGSL